MGNNVKLIHNDLLKFFCPLFRLKFDSDLNEPLTFTNRLLYNIIYGFQLSVYSLNTINLQRNSLWNPLKPILY